MDRVKVLLMKLLSGLLENTDGKLLLMEKWDGKTATELRGDISYVTQHSNLFNASLRDNITLLILKTFKIGRFMKQQLLLD